ncbi:hypothetical protein Tco_1297279 [Tanacetum coccineum]
MGDENPIHTLGDYSKPSHEGYMNTIKLPIGNNVVPLLSVTIRLVQNGCSFHGLRSEDPNQHLKDFLKLVDSLDLDVDNRERTPLRSLEDIPRIEHLHDKEHIIQEKINNQALCAKCVPHLAIVRRTYLQVKDSQHYINSASTPHNSLCASHFPSDMKHL